MKIRLQIRRAANGKSSKDEDDLEDLKERIEKKECIIIDRQNKIDEMTKELRDTRMQARKQEDEGKKMITSLLYKDEQIKRLKEKMANLSTKDMQTVKKKVVKKSDSAVCSNRKR